MPVSPSSTLIVTLPTELCVRPTVAQQGETLRARVEDVERADVGPDALRDHLDDPL
jgi:hypothetical protein